MIRIVTKKRLLELEKKQDELWLIKRQINDVRVWCHHISPIIDKVCDFLEWKLKSPSGCNISSLRDQIEEIK